MVSAISHHDLGDFLSYLGDFLSQVRMVDAPNGGGFLEIETGNKTYALRSGDSAVRP